MPTLQVLAGDQALFDPGFLTDTNLEAVLPFEVLTWYRSDDGAWFAQKLLEESGPYGQLEGRRIRGAPLGSFPSGPGCHSNE